MDNVHGVQQGGFRSRCERVNKQHIHTVSVRANVQQCRAIAPLCDKKRAVRNDSMGFRNNLIGFSLRDPGYRTRVIAPTPRASGLSHEWVRGYIPGRNDTRVCLAV